MDLQERLTAKSVAETPGSRVLVTLLFTDLARSTERAVRLGDLAWRELLGRHHERVRELLDRCDGHEVDSVGDGFFATFTTASQAVRCGLRLSRSLRTLGLEARVGIHTGECERLERKVSGVAVHAAARVVALAEPTEVLVTSTVREVVAGSELRFVERGEHVLRGLPGVWHLYGAVDTSGDGRPMIRHAHARRSSRPGSRHATAGPGRP